ncbi:TPA: phage head-tail adapter protein [Streptococcus suis]
MRWNEDCILISLSEEPILDELLQPIHIEVDVEVSCNKRSLTRSEYYFASQANMNPSMVLEVHGFEYDNQVYVDFEGVRYEVIKTFENGDIVELTCEVVKNGTGSN